MQRQQEAQQQQLQAQQQQAQMEAHMKEADMQLRDTMNQRDNETKILIASMNSQNQDDGIKEQEFSEEARANLLQKMKEFDSKLKLERDKLEEQKRKNRADESLKARQIKSRNSSK